MITKEEALEYIRNIAVQKIITKDELVQAYNSGSGEIIKHEALSKNLNIAQILYYIGGAIVFLGIAILVGQNWSTLGFLTKLLATLGSGIATYFIGLLFSRDRRTEILSSAFYLISALVTPIGLWVIFDNFGYTNSLGVQSLISGIMFLTYLLSLIVFRKNIIVLFSILFGTWFFFSLTSWIIGGNPIFSTEKFDFYRVLVTGIAYMFLGHAFSKDSEHVSLSGFLYGFGVFGFLASALALGNWKPNQNIFWELIYPVLVFGALFLSVTIKSRAFLTWGTVFLMGYILKITAEYFSTGLGWPLALVIAGLSMIGVGYMSFSIKKKYLISQ
jgi:hypothetical protein